MVKIGPARSIRVHSCILISDIARKVPSEISAISAMAGVRLGHLVPEMRAADDGVSCRRPGPTAARFPSSITRESAGHFFRIDRRNVNHVAKALLPHPKLDAALLSTISMNRLAVIRSSNCQKA